jgi:ankyrin repeat protein
MSNYPEIYYSYSSIQKEVKIPKILEGAMKNDINMIKLGLDNGENINSSLDGDEDTALHLSSYKGNKEIVQLLLNHPKIDVNLTNDYDISALYLACEIIMLM